MNRQFLWQQYAKDPNYAQRTALQFEQQYLTWQTFSERIDQFAFCFVQQGVKAGHTVALCGKNSLDLLLAYCALLQLGGRVLLLNPAFSASKIQQLCRDHQAVLLWSEQQCVALTQVEPQQDFVALTLTLTSGSSGQPKAVAHRIDDHLANAQGVCQLMGFQAEHCWLLSLPLFHVSGQGIIWRWLLTGARLQLVGDNLYAAMAQATHLSLVPTQLQRWLAYLADNPVQSQQKQHILLGGSHIPLNLVKQAEQQGFSCYCGYGMTEMASTVFAKRYDERAGVGQALAGREYCLVNGEIWLRGAGLGLGYWQNGQLIPLCNQQGWLQTKDRGYWQDNELVIAGRLDNMFISGGENIQPEEIEKILLQYEELKQAVVLAVNDNEFGQRPVAMVEFAHRFSQNEVNKLTHWLSNRLEKFKQPIAYFPLPEQAQSGIKVSRYGLQQQLAKIWDKE